MNPAVRDIVLVVDDQPGTLGLLNDALEQAGYTVLVAPSGRAALDVVTRATPDIILLDALMPGLDGFETCRRLKRLPALAAVPVIFMTALSETEHVLAALEAGGVDYVTKPMVLAEVVARLGVHLANARLTQSAHRALDAAGRFLLAIDRTGRVVWSTPQAAALLERGGTGPREAALPAEMVAWIQRLVAAGAAAPRQHRLLIGGQSLEISYVGSIDPDEILLRLARSVTPAFEEGLLRARLALTAREAEVLLWLGRGKTNRDIGEILGLSPRTVNKHLEGIYTKLGVENRAAAAALVVRTLQGDLPRDWRASGVDDGPGKIVG